MSNRSIWKILIVAIAAMAMVGMFAMPAAATEHTTTLAGDGTDEVTDFDGTDDEQYIEFTLDANGADFGEDGTEEVTFNVTYDGVEHHSVTEEVDAADVSHTFNISYEDIGTVPGGAEETTIVDVTAWGEDGEGTETTTAVNFETDLVFSNEHAAIYVHDHEDDDFATFDSEDTWFGFSSSESATIEDEVAIDGDNTTVQVHVADSDVQDQIGASTDGLDDGDIAFGMMASTLNDQLTYAYANEAGETIFGDDIEGENQSYMVVNSDDHLTIHPGEDAGNSLDASVIANDRPSASDLRSDLDFDMTASWTAANSIIPTFSLANFWPFSIAGGGLFAFGLVALRRRRDIGA